MKLFYAFATLGALVVGLGHSSFATAGFPAPTAPSWAWSGVSFTQPTCSNSNFQLVSDNAADLTGWTGTAPNKLSCYCTVTTAPGSNYISSSVTVTVVNASNTDSGTTSVSSNVAIGGNLLDSAGGYAASTTNLFNVSDMTDFTYDFDQDYYDYDTGTDSSMTNAVAPLGQYSYTYTYSLWADAE